MPGSTPNRGYPYPLVGESPAGHTQIQDLAMAVDADQQGEGRWSSYTPALTGSGALTLGNGTLAGAYTRHGETVIGQAKVTLGSTSAMGTGYVQMALPFAQPASGGLVLMLASLYDASLDIVWAGIAFNLGGEVRCYPWPDTKGQPLNFTPTYPFPSWGAGDSILAQFLYRAA